MKPSSSSFKTISLNNAAVQELRFQKAKEAIALLTSALKQCQSDMNYSLSSRKVTSNMGLDVDDYIRKQQEARGSSLTAGTSPDESSSLPFEEDENSSYFYADPILLPLSVVEGTSCTIGTMVEICAVITFNLGIALYRLSSQVEETGTTNTTKKTKTLRKSLAFFEKTKVICQARVLTNSSSVPLFSMVILNNMGVLLRLLGQTESSQLLFEEVIVLCWMHVCASNMGSPHPKQQQSLKSCILMLDGFLSNALQGQTTVAGAA